MLMLVVIAGCFGWQEIERRRLAATMFQLNQSAGKYNKKTFEELQFKLQELKAEISLLKARRG